MGEEVEVVITISDRKKPRNGMLFKRLECLGLGKPVGSIDFDVDVKADTVFINFVEVDEHYRGQGIARRMLDRIFKVQPALVVFGTFTEIGLQRLKPLALELAEKYGVSTDLDDMELGN